MDDYLQFAQSLARQGGKLIRDNFDSELNIEMKSDNTPVTQIDKAINNMIIETVREKYPEHGLLGEEASFGSGNEEYQWLLDPLDGTAPFIMGSPHSTCIVGLLKNGELQVAAIYDPFNERLYSAARGQGATCNGHSIHVNSQNINEGYVLLDAESPQFTQKLLDAKIHVEPVAGAGYRSALLARGRVMAVTKQHFDFHDVGPSSLIVEEAGGKVTDINGQPFRFDHAYKNTPIIMSNGICHDDLLTILGEA